MAGAAVARREPDPDGSVEAPVETGEHNVLVRMPRQRPKADEPIPPAACESAEEPHTRATRRELRKASRYLSQFVQSFLELGDANEHLTSQLDSALEYERAHAAEQDAVIERWKTLAFKLKEKLAEAEDFNSELILRCEAAEARREEADMRSAAAQERAATLERAGTAAIEQAALAAKLSTKAGSKVVVSFGYGSRSNAVLRALMSEDTDH